MRSKPSCPNNKFKILFTIINHNPVDLIKGNHANGLIQAGQWAMMFLGVIKKYPGVNDWEY